ncbi:AzlC family ABC transporter permease [uncultured Megasphaera sp.]|uniref:AzlC family ABC transporter permease n=1 Tax=uncultured Megasphaera sp. TaxID=165188 RepID=UPI0026592C8A|nr:AzlC family ABC transporter permease [uncultured Megasphaera sp.]
MKYKALQAAVPYTLPICAGFLFIGMSYGFLMASKGFSVWYPFFMSMLIFAGSMEFVTIPLLLAPFNPLNAFILTLMVNARHLFYGISMLEPYRHTGWLKPYLIFGMCDESFSINCTVVPPSDVSRPWFMFFVTVLNHIYWVAGAVLGGLLGSWIQFDTTGIEFVMTALFTVMFVSQWQRREARRPALAGVACTLVCLLLFGSQQFLIPAMILITLYFLWNRHRASQNGTVEEA